MMLTDIKDEIKDAFAKPEESMGKLSVWESRRVVRRMENARKNTTYPPPEVLAAQKRRDGRGFYLGDKKNFLGSLRRADYVARPSTTDMSNSA